MNTKWLTALCFVIGCSTSQFTKEQELYDDVARYACYYAAGQRAADGLEGACPDFAKKLDATLSCPIVDQIIAVLERDLEACDVE